MFDNVEEEEKVSKKQSKEGVHTGGFTNHGQEYSHEFIVQKSEPKKSKEEIKKE